MSHKIGEMYLPIYQMKDPLCPVRQSSIPTTYPLSLSSNAAPN